MPVEQEPMIPPPPTPRNAAHTSVATLRLVGGTSTMHGKAPAPANAPLRVLWVRPWDDPKLASRGHDPRSAYVERFWVAVLGPSVVWLLRLLARELDELAPGEDLRLDLDFTARRLGLQHRGGRTSTFMRTIDRCAMFDLARLTEDGVLLVRRHLPSVPRRLHSRIPQELRDEIGQWFRTDEYAHLSVGETRLLASCMLMFGHGLHESAERIITLGVAPNAANEATAWAWAQRCTRPHLDRHR